MDKDLLQNSASRRPVIQPKKVATSVNCDGDSDQNVDSADTLRYMHTLMHGRFSTDLGDFAKDEAKKLKMLEKQRKAEDERRQSEQLSEQKGLVWRSCYWVWRNTLARFGEEWIFLALLGIFMAVISYLVDVGVYICTNARMWLFRDIFNSSPTVQYFAWILPALCLVLFSAGFTYLVAPQAAGSGIPEMKTILRGVVLKEYLTFKTLVAKIVALIAGLGSGIPIGKEGPFVHMASIAATLLSKLRFHNIYENKSHHIEMLAVACAVGIGACFAAPIGGVLFSIEATATYFAVRNCWRGFFSAVIGSSAFLLMAVWFQDAVTVKALFQTNFTSEFPFGPQELFAFALLGVLSGFLGAGYVWLHRTYVTFIRSNKTINRFLQKNHFIYPTIIALVVSSVSFPLGTGQFMASEISTHEQLTELFSNFTWSRENSTVEQAAIISHWKTPHTNIFVHLAGFTLYTYVFSVICYTLPIPSGSFVPVFKIGAGFGRIFGELMHVTFPQGVWYGGILSSIVPGGYAVAGAAALSSAVTHTVSEAVIIFEITGQVTHVVPVMIASLISVAVAELLQPSMYDSMILIKKLPYLPELLPTSSRMYSVLVNHFMTRDVKYIWHGITYRKLKELLRQNKTLRSFPLVDSPESMILLGSIQRSELSNAVEKQISRDRRMEIATKWFQAAEEKVLRERQQDRRRSSRFEVFPAPDFFNKNEATAAEPTPEEPSENGVPPKSILKKGNSFNLNPTAAPAGDVETRIRSAFEEVLKRSSNLQDADSDCEPLSIDNGDSQQLPSTRKVQLSRERIIDMLPEDKRQWEIEEMSKPVDLNENSIVIDPSPFQLVEGTPIVKVHTLFNMVGINHAYVTKIGRLVGVVGLKELRKAIEDINSNHIVTPNTAGNDEAKPLIVRVDSSHKDVNRTITSMDSAVSVGY